MPYQGNFPPQGGQFGGGQMMPGGQYPQGAGGQPGPGGFGQMQGGFNQQGQPGPGGFGPVQGGFNQQGRQGPFMQGGPGMGGQGGQGFGPGTGGQGQGGPGMMGGPDEKQMKQREEQMLKDMKRGSAQMERGVVTVEKRLKVLEGKGVPISEETKSALEKAKSLVSKMQGVQSADEIQDLGLEDFGDIMQTLNEGLQKAEMGAQFPKMLKQANNMLKQQQSALKRAQLRATSLKINVESLLADWQNAVNGISQAVSQADQLYKDGNIEAAIDRIKDNVFDAFQDIGDKQRVFEMVSNMQKMVKDADREIKNSERQIARVKKQGKDTSSLESLMAQGKAKLAEIKQAITQSNIDPDALIDLVQSTDDIRQQFMEELSSLTGQQFGESQQIPGLQMQQLQMPQGFEQFMKNNGPPQGPGVMMGPGGMQGGFGPGGGAGGNQGGGPMMQPSTSYAAPQNPFASIVEVFSGLFGGL